MRGAAIGSLHPVAALVSAGTTAAILAALIAAGVLSRPRKPEPKALTVVSLAALRGSEAGEVAKHTAEALEGASAKPVPLPPAPQMPAQAQPMPLPLTPLPATMPVVIAPPAVSPTGRAATSEAATSSVGTDAVPAAAAPAAPARGAREGLAADAPAGTSRAYAARVRSWLLSHKVYPKYARMRRIEGVVRVRFVLDRRGRLVEGVLANSSGEASLDSEGEAMLRRASPYPSAPADIAGERIAFTAAIAFALTD